MRVWAFVGPRVAGTLVTYSPDSLSLNGTAAEGIPFFTRPLFFPETRRYEFDWVNVRRIDVPNGRDVVRGAAGGAGAAFLAGGFISLLCRGARGTDCGWLRWSLPLAVFTVPAGTVLGFFTTRWKRVF